MLRAATLIELLRDRGITQTALAAQMGMTRGHVNDALHSRVGLGRAFMDALRRTLPDDYDRIVVWVDDADHTEGAAS